MNHLLERLTSSLPLARTTHLQTSSPLVAEATCTGRSREGGLAEVQLKVQFTNLAGRPNPRMTLAILIDRGGPLPEATSRRRVIDSFATTPPYFFTAPAALLNYVADYGAGCELLFYDSEVYDAGSVRSVAETEQCVRAHPPTGSMSQPIPAIEKVVRKLSADQGLYLLVFSKHLAVDEVFIIEDMLKTRFPKAHPSTLCVHVIDTGPAMRGGSGMSLGESRKLESTFNDRDQNLLRYQSSYSPGTIGEWHTDRGLLGRVIENLDRMFIGVSDVHLEERVADPGATSLLRLRELRSDRWFSGPSCSIGFLPSKAQLALEFAAAHPPTTEVVIRCSAGSTRYSGRIEDHSIPLCLPIPRSGARRRG